MKRPFVFDLTEYEEDENAIQNYLQPLKKFKLQLELSPPKASSFTSDSPPPPEPDFSPAILAWANQNPQAEILTKIAETELLSVRALHPYISTGSRQIRVVCVQRTELAIAHRDISRTCSSEPPEDILW